MIPRWLARWLRKPAPPAVPVQWDATFLKQWGRDSMNVVGTPLHRPDYSMVEVKPNPLDYQNAVYSPTMQPGLTPFQAASTLSRHGHAKRRASYREFHDAMAKAAGRPPIVWR